MLDAILSRRRYVAAMSCHIVLIITTYSTILHSESAIADFRLALDASAREKSASASIDKAACRSLGGPLHPLVIPLHVVTTRLRQLSQCTSISGEKVV